MTAVALLISAGISAQNAVQTQTQTEAEKQNRSSATIQTQTQGQYQNYGQMTSEQKQHRNEERHAPGVEGRPTQLDPGPTRGRELTENVPNPQRSTRAFTPHNFVTRCHFLDATFWMLTVVHPENVWK